MRSSYLYIGTGACMALLTAGLIWINAATAPPDYAVLVTESTVQVSDTAAQTEAAQIPEGAVSETSSSLALPAEVSAANTAEQSSLSSSASGGAASLPILNAYPELEGIVIDLNHTNKEELDMLPNIGEKKAQAILDFVEENGPLDSVDRILEVKGIGEKTLETLRPYLTVS